MSHRVMRRRDPGHRAGGGMCLLGAAVVFAVASLVAGYQQARADQPARLIETPSLAGDVAAGRLPPVAGRLPQVPRIVDVAAMGRKPGRHGGFMRWLMGSEKDIRIAYYTGYARLVGYSLNYAIEPDLLERVEVEDGRIFTFRLRKGHRWSDGTPFTSEDFRYWWADVAHHPKLDDGNLPAELMVDGKPPIFEVLDEVTVRYTWHAPNPGFLPALARALPPVLFLPSRFLKQFHANYAPKKELAERVREAGLRNWRALHRRMGRLARPLEPTMPTLDPWINTTRPPSSLLVLRRNPFFHRVDAAGRQLPYIDGIEMAVGSASLIPAKTGAGDSDLQFRYLGFEDYTFLKAAERRGVIKVHLWRRGAGSQIALVPNLTTADPVWRALMRDVRVRRALSLAIRRNEINAAVYYGLARASADTVLPDSPLYRDAYANAFTAWDPATANRLLDAAGLLRRDYDGIRLLPDGRRAEIIVESAGESNEHAKVLTLVKDHWRAVGIAMFVRPTQRDLFRRRVYSGETVMSVWWGLDNATPTPDMSPARLAPVAQDQLQWSAWGHNYETKGELGEKPDMPVARELLALLDQWNHTRATAERAAIWHRMLAIRADQVFTIGLVNGARQPVAASPRLVNLPASGILSFEPGSYLGVYMPDTFFFSDAPPAGDSHGKGG
ncbi:MAG: ABC transporter substrate-binding protein [Hyphomicrobiaceae bacterium]